MVSSLSKSGGLLRPHGRLPTVGFDIPARALPRSSPAHATDLGRQQQEPPPSRVRPKDDGPPPSALAWGRSPLNARVHALQKRTANDVKEKSRVRVLLAGFSASLGNARASRIAARPAEGAAAALALVSCCSSQEIAWSCTRTA